MLKVDGGGSSTIQRQPETVLEPSVKPANTNTSSTQETNASVYANSNQNSQTANLIRFKLNAQFTTTAARTTPTITPQEAQQKAGGIKAKSNSKMVRRIFF